MKSLLIGNVPLKGCLLAACLCLWAVQSGGAACAQEVPVEARKKSVTIYPIAFSPADRLPLSISQRVAEVVGLLLERAGMDQIEIGASAFTPETTDDTTKLAAAFGQFVRNESLKTDYALFAQISGTRDSGITQIQTVVVAKTGEVILAERFGKEDLQRAKTRPTDPMTASVFLVERLGKVWAMSNPQNAPVAEGKMAVLMRQRSGLPSNDELEAMNKRLRETKTRIAASEVTVYPAHLWPGSDGVNAASLARLLNEQGICRAVVSATDPKLTIQGDPNQQKVLWDTARSFREFLRNNPPATPYALLPDYGLAPAADGKREPHYVHLILCDRAGDWVLVDYQNSHHEDFQNIAPRSGDDCNRLVAQRLKQRISQ
jgi:hypothetical protein